MAPTPFHEGEQALQRHAGSFERLAEVGPRVVRDHMLQQHRDFFAQLPMLLVGSVDRHGQPWASVLAGPPGFISSPDPQQLVVEARPLSHDPLREKLAQGQFIGLLGIEPHTRRRNRMNGVLTHVSEEGFTVQVMQSFGNCPKYIQARRPEFVPRSGESVLASNAAPVATQLDQEAVAMIRNADTFYIATAYPVCTPAHSPSQGVDVSHRGGKPGFVRVDGDKALTAPDFLGNFYFNTLGNIAVNPRAGLLFIDFDNGDLLYVAVKARIVFDGPALETFEGAQRLLHMEVQAVRRARAALPLRWSAAELSPHLLNFKLSPHTLVV
jgi:uncharacterized protein